MKYALDISLTEEALAIIAKTHQRIVLVKHTAEEGDTQVVWISFKPWMNNTVEWENDFSIYASNTEVGSGAIIRKLSDKQAATGLCYSFGEGYFDSPTVSESLPKNSYIVENQCDDRDGITIGLAQDVMVNGEVFEGKPVSAVFVPRGQAVNMTPIERLEVFLQNDIEDGTVISHIQSKAITVTYEEGKTTRALGYNDAIGKFYPVG